MARSKFTGGPPLVGLFVFDVRHKDGRSYNGIAVPVCSILHLISVGRYLPRRPPARECTARAAAVCPHGFSPRVVLTRPPPLRDSVAGRKCSMPSASHSPGGCRPPAGDVSRWLLVRGCRMGTLTCSVFKERRESERSAAHSFSANYAALFRGRLIYPFIFIGIEKGFFIEPF